MKTLSFRLLLSLLALGLFATAGTAQAQHKGHEGHAPKKNTHVNKAQAAVKMVNGVQVVSINVGAGGYAPEQITLKPGVKTRLVFTRTAEAGCMDEIQIPAFGIEATPLPLNEAVTFEVLPEEQGTFTFACGMDMARGALLVKS